MLLLAQESPISENVNGLERRESVKHLVEFKLGDGSVILVEVNEPEEVGGITRASRKPGEVFIEAKETFEQALEKIRTSAETAVAKLRALHERPDEMEMEFGFNLSAQFGAVIASATAEANYKVTLRWTRKEEQ